MKPYFQNAVSRPDVTYVGIWSGSQWMQKKNCFAVHAYARKHKCLWKIINNSACVLHMCYQWPMFSHLLTAFLARKGCLVHPALYGGATQPWWYQAWLTFLSKPLEWLNFTLLILYSSNSPASIPPSWQVGLVGLERRLAGWRHPGCPAAVTRMPDPWA